MVWPIVYIDVLSYGFFKKFALILIATKSARTKYVTLSYLRSKESTVLHVIVISQ